MTNREKYAEQILDIACDGDYVAVRKKDMKPDWCKNIECDECYFYNYNVDCYDTRKEWCESEYKEPPIDWSKVPVDTPILVRDKKMMNGYIDILRNLKTALFMHGMTGKHHGVH